MFCECGSAAVEKQWLKPIEITMNALFITFYSLEFQQDDFNLFDLKQLCFHVPPTSCSGGVGDSRNFGFDPIPCKCRASITDSDTGNRH